MIGKKEKKSTSGGRRPGAGRPASGVNYRAQSITMDDETIDRARRIGDGNISKGVRSAVIAFPISGINKNKKH
jgi:hypothetical protein